MLPNHLKSRAGSGALAPGEELQNLSVGLSNSSALLLKKQGDRLECEFVREGLVRYSMSVTCQVLAAALLQKSVNGIIAGFEFSAFRYSFDSFSLRVKARRLYSELKDALSAQHLERQTLAVA